MLSDGDIERGDKQSIIKKFSMNKGNNSSMSEYIACIGVIL